jgi:hypothetical protein
MKKLLFLILIIPAVSLGQNLTEYKALNNKTYHVGDTVKLGKGSSSNGDFLYLELSPGINSPFLTHGHNASMDKTYANANVVIKKIKQGKVRGVQKTWFVLAAGLGSLNLYVDDAVSACEIIPCQTKTTETLSVADEILKLKKLLDAGAITQSEYNAQKKKLLD